MNTFIGRGRNKSVAAALIGLLVVGTIAWAADLGKVTGTVTDKDGKPAAKVTVKLTQPGTTGGAVGPKDTGGPGAVIGVPHPNELGKPDKVVKQGVTDAAGNFAFDGVPAGNYACVATDGKYSVQQGVTVQSGKTATVTLSLKP
jgi:hypothetical protein